MTTDTTPPGLPGHVAYWARAMLRMAELERTLQHIADTSDDHDSRASAIAALATPTAGDAT